MRKLLTTLLALLLLASTTFADTFRVHYSIRGSGFSVKNLITRQCVEFFRMVVDRQQIRYITLPSENAHASSARYRGKPHGIYKPSAV